MFGFRVWELGLKVRGGLGCRLQGLEAAMPH